MNLFFIFAGDYYYPRGGTLDLVDTFPSLEDALSHQMGTISDDWADVYEYNGREFIRLYSHGYNKKSESYWYPAEVTPK